MLWGNRKTGPTAPKRGRKSFRPADFRLEPRLLLTAIDLADVAGSLSSGGPYGVLDSGTIKNLGAGYSVADLGDVNADGYDDFLIGAPTVVADPTNPSLPFLGTGANSVVYLIFGSAQVGPSTFDYLNLTPINSANPIPMPTNTGPPFNQRVGDLAQTGNTNQTNPLSAQAGFNYDGLTFTTNSNTAQLGASVAGVGDVNGDGIPDFMIGAPGADGGSGRAYLIYGSSGLNNPNRANKTINLDDTTANPDIKRITFTGTANSRTGRAVAGAGDFITDGFPDILIGAPNTSVGGLVNNGAVYVISGTYLRNPPALTAQPISLASVGQPVSTTFPNPVPGFILAGQNGGDSAGESLAAVGNVNGARTSAGTSIADIFIGAPDESSTGTLTGPGSAYLVYGGLPATLQSYAIPVSATNALAYIPLAQVGASAGGTGVAVPGAIFNGDTLGDLTGRSVAAAGDFNGDGFNDIVLGSPGFGVTGTGSTAFDGRVDIIYGAPTGNANELNGVYDLNDVGTAFLGAEIDGEAGSGAGFSVSSVGSMNQDSLPEVLIGAPAFNGGSGRAYLIPGNSNLGSGVFQLGDTTSSAPLFEVIFAQSTTSGVSYFGSSVRGNLLSNSSGRFIDGDGIPDFVIGAASFHVNDQTPITAAGATYVIEGAFVKPLIPTPSGGVTPIPPIPPPSGGSGTASSRNTLLNGSAVPQFGEALIPTPAALSHLRWKPLPKRVAFNQFLPSHGFTRRMNQFLHPKAQATPGSKRRFAGDGAQTLGKQVFKRGRFAPGVHFGVIRHRGATIPRTA